MNDPVNNERPSMENRPIPLWIKLMWFFGVVWIITYMVIGLSHPPG